VECFFDVGSVPRRDFKVTQTDALGELLGFFVGDDSLAGHVSLVAQYDLVDVLGAVTVALLQPLSDVGEGGSVRDVKDDTDSMTASVVAARDGSEALLASGIPHLVLDDLAFDRHGTDLEVHSDGADVRLREEGVVREPQQNARLPHARVTNHQNLEQVITSVEMNKRKGSKTTLGHFNQSDDKYTKEGRKMKGKDNNSNNNSNNNKQITILE